MADKESGATASSAVTGAAVSTEEDMSESLGLLPGSVVSSKHNNYEIVKTLGEGGFGAVFKVKLLNEENKFFAMKVEPRQARKHNKLKMEIDILKRVSKERKDSHFAQIIDRGKKDELFVFLVMDLVGPSLADLKDMCPRRVFPLATGLGVANQCLEAIEDLHKHGFIHRDLKPANYARGRGAKRHVIYILDFGIARKVTTTENVLKTPRGAINFKGTIRFASIRCHLNRDISYPDDCESWYYLLLDLVVEGGLPWKRVEDKNKVLEMKQACLKEKRDLIAPKILCREKFLSMIDYIISLDYHNPVDYSYLYKMIEQAASISKVDIDAPYEWEKKPSKSVES